MSIRCRGRHDAIWLVASAGCAKEISPLFKHVCEVPKAINDTGAILRVPNSHDTGAILRVPNAFVAQLMFAFFAAGSFFRFLPPVRELIWLALQLFQEAAWLRA